jgi:hypothetical protein
VTLLALASPALCAAALRQPPPTEAEETVRVILDGSAAMGLTVVCGPWDHAAEVDGVRDELGGAPSPSSERLGAGDTVTGWLVGSPGVSAVVAPVSGPLWLAAEADAGDPQDALDAASDFVADRVRALCELGVAHVVVLEASGGRTVDAAAAAEAHTPIARLARHFGVPVTLVALDDAVPAGALGYERWTSPEAGSGDVRLVTADSLRDARPEPGATDAVVVTDYLTTAVEPAQVRELAAARS